MRTAAWIALCCVGFVGGVGVVLGQLVCDVTRDPPPEPVRPTIPKPPPLDRHWPHQTLDSLLRVDDPDALIAEAPHPIVGAAYLDVLRDHGGTVPDLVCRGNGTTTSACHETTKDELYLPGVVDDHPFELRLTVEDAHRTITAFTIVLDTPAATETVPALLERKLGPPNRITSELGETWVRGTRTIKIVAAADPDRVALTVSAFDPAVDPRPAWRFIDPVTDPACKRMLERYRGYARCAKIALHDRLARSADLLPRYDSDYDGPALPGTCADVTAQLTDAMTAAGC